jgi:hypothetical protein
MGRTPRSGRYRAQAPPKPKIKTPDEIEQLRKENRQLRELVAHLAKLALDRIADAAKPGEESTRLQK